MGIGIANEGVSSGFQLNNIRVTNNIVEGTGQALRYWRSHSGGASGTSYGNLYVGFNTFAHTQTWPVRFDGSGRQPPGLEPLPPEPGHQHQRLGLVLDGELDQLGGREELQLQLGHQRHQPGRRLRRRQLARRLPAPGRRRDSLERAPVVRVGRPSQDYYCQNRNPGDWSYGGALR